jgi:hypothetical protein
MYFDHTGIPKSALGNKARQVRDSLKLYQCHPEFSRRKLLVSSPVPWLVEFNGLIMGCAAYSPLPLTPCGDCSGLHRFRDYFTLC